MNTSRMAGAIGMAIGLILVYAAYNSGDRVIVGALPGGQPIFEHVTNKPMLGIGTVLTAGSILLFAMSFVGGAAAASPPSTDDSTDTSPADPESGSDESSPDPLEDTRD